MGAGRWVQERGSWQRKTAICRQGKTHAARLPERVSTYMLPITLRRAGWGRLGMGEGGGKWV